MNLVKAEQTYSLIFQFSSNINLAMESMSILLFVFNWFIVPLWQIKNGFRIRKGKERLPPPSSLTCGFIPVKPEKVIKHNEDLCRTKSHVRAGERARKSLSQSERERERGVHSGIVLLECVCPPHLPVEKSNGLVWFPGNTLPLCSICSTTRHPINR